MTTDESDLLKRCDAAGIGIDVVTFTINPNYRRVKALELELAEARGAIKRAKECKSMSPTVQKWLVCAGVCAALVFFVPAVLVELLIGKESLESRQMAAFMGLMIGGSAALFKTISTAETFS